jgi:hypothetical protein
LLIFDASIPAGRNVGAIFPTARSTPTAAFGTVLLASAGADRMSPLRSGWWSSA